MADLSRRSFLTRGSASAAGVIGAISAGPAALAAITTSAVDPELSTEELEMLNGPMFVHVRDAATGEIEVMVEDTSLVFNDKALVAKVLRGGK